MDNVDYWVGISINLMVLFSAVLVVVISYLFYSMFCYVRGKQKKDVEELWNDFVTLCLALTIAVMGVIAILFLLFLALYNRFCQKFFKKDPIPSISMEPD